MNTLNEKTLIMNYIDPDVQAGFRKGRENRDQIAKICWIIEKERVPEKCLLLLYWLFQSLWLCRSQQTVENSESDGNTNHLTCILRNLYAGQEATVRTGHGTTDWFQIRRVHQGCILSPCLFNLYAEYIIWNTRLDEAQARIKIARRNISNFRYADDTNLLAESEELKSLLMKVREESEEVGLKIYTYRKD